MIHASHPQTKQPRHPECLLYRLPMELLLEIIRLGFDLPCFRTSSFPFPAGQQLIDFFHFPESYLFDSADGELKQLPEEKHIMDAAWGETALALTCKLSFVVGSA